VNAKPTALAAVVVMIAGVAAGAAIGGKTETRTRTVTVAASGDTGATSTVPTASPVPEPERTPGFEPVVLDEDLVTIDDATVSTAGDYDEEVTLVDVKYGGPAQLQQGPEKSDAITFDFDSSGALEAEYAADYYQLEITVPDGATRLVSEIGFLKGEATGNRVKVAFYKNEPLEGSLLGQRQLGSASETAPVELVVAGASKIVARFTCMNKGRMWRTPSDDTPSFGFLDAHFE